MKQAPTPTNPDLGKDRRNEAKAQKLLFVFILTMGTFLLNGPSIENIRTGGYILKY